jgi:hypothetical protein
MIHLATSPATREQLDEMLETLGTDIIVAVDVEHEILAGGSEAHTDCEERLLDAGSRQEDIWGATWNVATGEVTFWSVINWSMIDKVALERDRVRFQHDTIDGQLARLRSNLDIVATRISDGASSALVKQAIDQAAWFCEWAFMSTEDEETRIALVECQRFTARCRNHWREIIVDEGARVRVAAEAAHFSDRLLALFGLLRSEAV